MRRLTKFEKFGLAAAIVVAGTFFYMKKVYDPQEKALKKTVERLNKVVAEVNNLKETPPLISVRERIEKQKKLLGELKEKMAQRTVKTGAQHEITELLGRITKCMTRHRLILKGIVPKPVVPGDFFPWNVYQMTMECSHSGLIAFLEELKGMEDAVRVRELRLEKSEGKPLQATFDLMI
ncbi:MAG: type 4a pilus biogenesis protein PilO [Deltaproteobacteria bacterium]|nr:type 4a pilus biogenesis protein PilO [Deltaproteobacteria bacterium]